MGLNIKGNVTYIVFSLLFTVLQLVVLQPKVAKEEQEGASLLTLIKDPYILIAAGKWMSRGYKMLINNLKMS